MKRIILFVAVFAGTVGAAQAYTLNYTVQNPSWGDSCGDIIGATNQAVSLGENGTEVYVRSHLGYVFDQWSDGLTNNPRTDLNVQGDISVTALFEEYSVWTHDKQLDLAPFGPDYPLEKIIANFASFEMAQDAGSNWVLDVSWETDGDIMFPYLGTRDLSEYRGYCMKITNTGDTFVYLRFSASCDSGWQPSLTAFGLKPGETDILYSVLNRPGALISDEQEDFFDGYVGSKGFPGGHVSTYGAGIWTNATGGMKLFLKDPDFEGGSIRIEKIWAGGHYNPPSVPVLEQTHAPVFDEFYQYDLESFVNKVYDEADFQAQWDDLEARIAAEPQPPEYNQYGGWANAPQWLLDEIAADTNVVVNRFSRYKDSNGKWWLVDPSGAPFISLGAIGMSIGKTNAFSSSATYLFASVPAYANLGIENLQRRFGSSTNWWGLAADSFIRKWKYYGLNTVGGYSSNGDTVWGRNFPYCLHISAAGPMYYKVPSNLNEAEMRATVRETLEGSAGFAQGMNDPWCVGVFMHNEISFEEPDEVSSEIWYRVLREEIKRLDPDMMFIGCKSSAGSDAAWTNAVKYCDVLSVDHLVGSLGGGIPHGGLGAPIILGAYSTAALDEGTGNNSQVGALTHKQRGILWKYRFREMCENPNFVGAHQFAHGTGTWKNGNGYQQASGIPYYGFIDAVQEIAARMYTYHADGVNTGPTNNTPPVWRSSPFYYDPAPVDIAYSYLHWKGSAEDRDGDTLTYNKISGPAWATLNTSSGKVTGTPLIGDLGLNELVVTVSDGVNPAVTNTLKITVYDPLVVNYLTDGNGYIFKSGDATQYIQDNGVEIEARANSGYHWVSWSDGYPTAVRQDLAVTEDISVTAYFEQAGPQFNSEPFYAFTAAAGWNVGIDFDEYVSDLDGDALSYTVLSFAGPGSDWLSAVSNGVFSGTPAAGDIGTNTWTVEVDDGFGHTATGTAVVVVSDAIWGEDFSSAVLNESKNAAYINATHATGQWIQYASTSSNQLLHIQGHWNKATTSANIALDESLFAGAGNYRLHFEILDAYIKKNLGILGVDIYDAHTGLADGATSGESYSFQPLSSLTTPEHPVVGANGAATADLLGQGTYHPEDDRGHYSIEFQYDGTGDIALLFSVVCDRGRDNAFAEFDDIFITKYVNNPVFFSASLLDGGLAVPWESFSGSIAGSATDADVLDPMSYSIVSGPTWLSMTQDGTLSGIPYPADLGLNSWTVQVDDERGSTDTATLQIEVTDHINYAPEFASDPIVKSPIAVDMPYSGSLVPDVSDANGDTLTFSKLSGPSWLTVNANGTLSGTPTVTGIYTSNVQVVDGFGGIDSAVLQVVVASPPPSIWAEDFSVDPNADRDYSLANIPTEHPRDKWIFQDDVPGWNIVDQHLSLPDGLRGAGIAISSGYFTQTGTYTLKFSHEAVGGVPATDSLAVNVYEGHASNSVYTLDLRAAGCGNATATAPATISLLASTNSLSGDQAVTQYELEFDYNTLGKDIVLSIWRQRPDATTSGDMYVDDLSIWADGVASNAAPIFSADPIDKGTVAEGAYNGTLSGSATDSDGDALVYGKLSGPAWLQVAPDGTLSGSPDQPDLGTNSWTVIVDDGNGGTDTAILEMVISPANDAPEAFLDPLTLTGIVEGRYYTTNLAWNVSDEEGDPVTFTKLSGKSWVQVSSDGTITGYPSVFDLGLSSWCTIQLTDGQGGTNTFEVKGEVVLNLAPDFGSSVLELPRAEADIPYAGTLADYTVDVNGDSMTFFFPSNNIGPVWLSLSPDGTLSGTPSVEYYGANEWDVYVVDSYHATNSALLQIQVDAPPQFSSSPVVLKPALVGEAYAGSLATGVYDPNGDAPITFVKASGPAWLTIASNGSVSGMPGAGDAGWNTGTVLAIDSRSTTNAATFSIEVRSAASVLWSEDFNNTNDLSFIWDGNHAIYDSEHTPGTTNWTGHYPIWDGSTLVSKTDDKETRGQTIFLPSSLFSGISAGTQLVLSVDIAGLGTEFSGAGLSVFGVDISNGDVLVDVTKTSAGEFGTVVQNSGSPVIIQHWQQRYAVPGTQNIYFDYSGSGGVVLLLNSMSDTEGELSYVVYDNLSLAVSETPHYAPAFTNDPMIRTDAVEGQVYSATIAGAATDADGDPLAYSKASGPAWLNVATNGALSGTPGAGDVGATNWTVQVDDGNGGTDAATLTITVIAAPDTYDTWTSGYDLSGDDAATTNDYDSDGWNNLLEYALNGNPTNPMLTGVSPVSMILPEGGTNWIEYIHLERTTPGHGLTYTIEQTPDLVDTPWSNATDAVVAGEGTLNSDFKTVTNNIPMDGKATEFLRLRIDHE